jgi:hypothetical protein
VRSPENPTPNQASVACYELSHEVKKGTNIVAMPLKGSSEKKQRLTLAQLTAYDDILTDALVDHVSFQSFFGDVC